MGDLLMYCKYIVPVDNVGQKRNSVQQVNIILSSQHVN